MSFPLVPHRSFRGVQGPVVLAILDGVGVGAGDEGDAVHIAPTPTLDELWAPGLRATLKAHGTAVGLPSDGDMGNSEVGHNAMGAGRIYDQGARRVNKAIASGEIFEGPVWGEMIERCRSGGGAFHFIGLLSDGNVHSHLDHLEALVRRAAAEGAPRIYVHALLDGRDVPSQSALQYIDRVEAVLAEISAGGECDAAIASGGGRMLVTMDRYEADWSVVERGWRAHVHGDARPFPSARAAVEALRDENPGVSDQQLPAFVIARDSEPVGPIRDGDSVACFNFRGDRAIELSRAFDEAELTAFDRGRIPDVYYAGMMEYDGDLKIPSRYLVAPPWIDRTMGEYLARNGVSQLAIAETQKFGHVTYFWNGNRSGKFDEALETYIEIPSERAPFEERPWMKAAEITDALIERLERDRPRFVRLNFANGDMVGHTGAHQATMVAMSAIDLQLARLRRALDRLGGALVVTADHGNADEMYQRDKEGRVQRDPDTGAPVVKTSHTLSPVPFMIHDAAAAGAYEIDPERAERAGIANVAATCFELLGFEPPEDYEPSILRFS